MEGTKKLKIEKQTVMGEIKSHNTEKLKRKEITITQKIVKD